MERSPSLLRRTGYLLLLGASAAIGGCGGGDLGGEPSAGGGTGGVGCPAGSEGCACYGNDTCNAGLTCASHLCVSLASGGSGQGGVSPGGASSGGAGTGGRETGGFAQGGVSVGGTYSGSTGTGGTFACALGSPCSTPNSYCVEGIIVCQCINGAWSSCRVNGSGGAPGTGGIPATGGLRASGGLASGGSNNPAGCPATQPASRDACIQGSGPCTYGTQLCECGQYYSTSFQWRCGNAPPATGGTTGSGGRPSGGTGSGGRPTGGTASGGRPTGGSGSGGFPATGGRATGGTAGTAGATVAGGTAGGGGTGGVACVPGVSCSGVFTCSPAGGGLCMCTGTALTCTGVVGGSSGSAGAPPASGGASAAGAAGNAGAGGEGGATLTHNRFEGRYEICA
jgi:hypothetical protein